VPPASAATAVKVPPGFAVAALSAGGNSPSSSSSPASAAAAVKAPAGSAAAALSAGQVSSLPPDPAATLAAITAATGGAVDLAAMAAAQRSCPSTQSLEGSSLHLHAFPFASGHILCDISRGITRPIVPEQYRRDVFSSIHTIAHPGTRATRRLISARFCWKGMAADIAAWCRECQGCNRGKVTAQPAAPVQPIPIPCRRFTHVHVDLVGPLPVSAGGFNHIFTMIDRSTRWLEAVPLKDISATSCAETFVAAWVARFGVPECITSDRGPQFTSAVWSALCAKLGMSRSLTTAFHPQSNGMVERAHRQLKDALRARAAGHDWPLHLPWVLLGLRTAPKEDSNISSAELCLGAPLTLPGEFIAGPEPPPQEFVDSLRAAPPPPSTRPRSYAQVAASPPASLLKAAFVYIRRGGTVPSLQPLYAGPYRVLSGGEKCFTVDIGGKAEVVSIDRLKPHLGQALIAPAPPPPRGRPPKPPSSSTAVPPGGRH
jgi:cleavage and polyadenylation specificity factor subunit 1